MPTARGGVSVETHRLCKKVPTRRRGGPHEREGSDTPPHDGHISQDDSRPQGKVTRAREEVTRAREEVTRPGV